VNQCFKYEVFGSYCKHDFIMIKDLQVELGRIYPIINPVDKVRFSEHQFLAHSEIMARERGCNMIGESGGEFWHQMMKRGARKTVNIPAENRLIQTVVKSRQETNL